MAVKMLLTWQASSQKLSTFRTRLPRILHSCNFSTYVELSIVSPVSYIISSANIIMSRLFLSCSRSEYIYVFLQSVDIYLP